MRVHLEWGYRRWLRLEGAKARWTGPKGSLNLNAPVRLGTHNRAASSVWEVISIGGQAEGNQRVWGKACSSNKSVLLLPFKIMTTSGPAPSAAAPCRNYGPLDPSSQAVCGWCLSYGILLLWTFNMQQKACSSVANSDPRGSQWGYWYHPFISKVILLCHKSLPQPAGEGSLILLFSGPWTSMVSTINRNAAISSLRFLKWV